MLFPAQATQGGGGIGNTTCKAQPSAYMAPKGADQVLHPAQAAQGGSGTATYQAQPGAFVTPQGTQQVLYPSQTPQGKAGSTTYQAQPSAYLQGQGVNPNSQAEYSVTSLYPSQTAAAHAPGTPSRAQGGQHSGPQEFTLYPATVSQQGVLQPQGAARGAQSPGVMTLYASDAPPSSRR